MSAYKDFRTNKGMEKDGIWLDYGDYKILIARAGGANKAFDRCLENKAKPYRRALQNGVLSTDRQEELMLDVYVETVILGWEGVTNDQDQPLEFNKENLRMVLKDLPDLWRDILLQAQQAALFREDIKEAEAGNS